ncbi:disulfide bond formation protein B [Ideonella sp. DXS22W]|uniref:Disulfide bond formation protein B n=1 Tax=Pseudaquabacterium inlustre TaxID=2984192 RepID=A0ABU9CFY2_9BURK
MSSAVRPVPLLLAAAVASFGAVGAALFTQVAWGMQPCPWCVLQRLIFVAIGTAALLGLLMRSRLMRRVMAALMGLLALGGMAAALWQHFVASKSASCNLTLADKIMSATGLDRALPLVFEATANCADASAPLLGLAYEFWSLGLYALLAVVALQAMRRQSFFG